MKVRISKDEVYPWYVLRTNASNSSLGKKLDLSSVVVNEILKFQRLALDVQKLLRAYSEGTVLLESGQIKKEIGKTNDNHNRKDAQC